MIKVHKLFSIAWYVLKAQYVVTISNYLLFIGHWAWLSNSSLLLFSLSKDAHLIIIVIIIVRMQNKPPCCCYIDEEIESKEIKDLPKFT